MRVFVTGATGLSRARAAYAERLVTWDAWEEVSNVAMGEPQKTVATWIEELAQQARD